MTESPDHDLKLVCWRCFKKARFELTIYIRNEGRWVSGLIPTKIKGVYTCPSCNEAQWVKVRANRQISEYTCLDGTKMLAFARFEEREIKKEEADWLVKAGLARILA